MAEIAAGAVIAEQVVSTSAEAGAAYTVAKPSMPLKASFIQIATSQSDGSTTSLTRSGHSVTVIGDRAYIFGGEVIPGKLASSDIHSVRLPSQKSPGADYQVTPALPMTVEQDQKVPSERTDHAACALPSPDRIHDKTTYVAIFGGSDASGMPLEDSDIWLYDPIEGRWACSTPEPGTALPSHRSGAKMFARGADIILYGGKNAGGLSSNDVWCYNTTANTWSRLPDALVSTSNAAFFGDSLYLISESDSVSSSLHHLSCEIMPKEPPTWETIAFPTNPLAPGPRPRENGGLLHITTGYGRNYLLYFFGDRSPLSQDDDQTTQWSDIWTFQLPSSNVEVHASTTISEAIKPAKIKDWIRSKLGGNSGIHTWAEVEVKPPGDLQSSDGKIHPGPRSLFGYDVCEDGRSVVIWGGQDARGEMQGDGWIIRLE